MNSNKTNKLKLLIAGAFVAFSQFLFSQGSTFEKMLINSDETSQYDVEGSFINSSGSIVVYGYQSKNNYDPFYLEIDPATGDTLKWVDATGTLFPERMQSMVELPTGGYIGVGYTTRSNQNYPWIIKFDTNGDTVFTKSFHTYSNTFASCTNLLQGEFKDVIVNSSGDLIVTGENDGCGNYMTLIAQLDAVDGSIDWINGARNFNVSGGINVESYRGRAVFQDGTNYVVAGDGYGGSSSRGTVIKFDSTGDTVWTSYASVQSLKDIIKASDGNYYATGNSNPFSISTNAAFVKISAAGVVGLTTHISPTGTDWSYGYSIAEGPNTNELLIGGVTQLSSASSDQALHSVSTLGVVNYSKYYGFGDWVDRAYVLTSGTDIYLTGNENWGWSAKENYGAIPVGSPPHKLRPTLSKHNADGEISGMQLTSGSQSGTNFCPGASFSMSPGYSNFSFTTTDINSNQISSNSPLTYVWFGSGGTVTITQDDKNGDTRTASIIIQDNPQPTIAGYDSFFNITSSACAGDSLLVVASGSLGSTFEWFVQGNGTAFSTNDSVYIDATTSIELRETSDIGCTGTTNQTITINTDQVNITSSDYPQKFNTSLGSGTDTNTRKPNAFKWAFNQDIEAWIAPVGGYKQQNAQQYLIKASELTALGLNQGSSISKIGFDFLDSYTSTIREFEIKIKETTASTVSSWNSFSSISSSFTDYWYYPSISEGTNYFTFSNSYEWDGTSNIIIQFSYVNDSWSSSSNNPRIRMSDVGYDATLIGYGTQTSSLASNNPPVNKKSQYRPNFYFEVAKGPLQDTIVGCATSLSLDIENSGYQFLQWSTNSSSTPVSISSAGLYTVQMLDANFCLSKDTVQVLFSAPSVAASASLIKGCDGDVSTITASGTFDSYIWSSGQSGNSITATESGSYVVTAFDEYSCTAKDTISVEFVEKPILYVGEEATHSGQAITDYVYLGEHNKHHYYYYTITHNYTWDQAKAQAEAMGGYLWSVNSQSEHEAVAQMYQSQSAVCCEAFNGAYKENGTWNWHSGEPFIYTNWASGQPDNPNGDSRIRVQWGWSDLNGTPGQWEDYGNGWDTQKYIVEFPANRRPMIANETFCDSVQIWTDQSFDSYLWSTGETDSLITVSATTASAITLSGTVNKSDGTTCSLTSDGTTITINTTPTITLTNNSGTVDYDGTNAISLTAGTSGSSTSFLWSNGATTSAISITAEGTYQVVGTDAGCSDSVSLRVYEPVYVDDDGSDSNGDGSLNLPYATLSKGYTEVSDGGKIYVLPGTYEEELEITKSVNIMSNYGRLGDTSAIATTIIEADNSNYALKINSAGSISEPVLIQGFTITGKSSNSYEAVVHAQSGAVAELRNIIFEENKVDWGWSEPAAALSVDGATILIEESSFVDNNPLQMNNPSVVSLRSSSKLTVKRCSFKDNYSDYSIISLWGGSNTLSIENSYFKDNTSYNGLIRSWNWDDAISLDHVTIQESLNTGGHLLVTEGNSSITVSNSVVQSTNSGTSFWYAPNGSASMSVSNSVIDVTGGLNHPSSNSSNLISSNNVLGVANILSDGSLDSISEAIGLGSVGLNFDFDNNTRPNPVGSNPDAGAFENNRAQGDFDATIQDCGYLLTANVLNSSSYSLSWSLAGQEVSTSNSFLATTLGVYSLTVTSVDRADTITKTINLNDPLRFDVIDYGNSCSAVSNSNGFIQWGNIQGGTQYTDDWYDYRTALNNEAGSQFDGYWNLDNGSNWSYKRDNMQDGKFYVFVEDGSGCIVGDTIEIVEQNQETYFVGNSGSDLNAGTSKSMPFATIQRALETVCHEDTIIILDGTYYADSIVVQNSIVIGSEYLLDGDTNHISATIIDGDDNGWIMQWDANSGSWSDTTENQLVGLTIQNGFSTDIEFAGGLTVYYNNVLKVNHVRFKNNESSNTGGAMYARQSSYLEVANSQFSGNHANTGAAIYSSYSRSRLLNLKIFNNTVSSNSAAMNIDGAYDFYSDGINVFGHQNTQHDYVVYMNLNNLNEDAVLRNWAIKNNSAHSKILSIYQQGSDDELLIENCLIANNTAQKGGPALQLRDIRNKVIISNTTISDNISVTEPQKLSAAMIAIRSPQNSPKVFINNSIIQNTSSTYTVANRWDDNLDLYIENSFVDGGSAKVEVGSSNGTLSYGTTNLTSGLYFTDAANGDYSLSSVSTLLGAGASTATVGGVSITAPTTDLYGNPRPNPSGTNPDIGAIESPESTPQVGIAVVTTDNGFCQTTSGAITANLLNYTGTATYSWSSSTYPTWTWNATQSATGLSSGDYKVVAIDATSGAKIDSTEITIATLPSISITNTSTDVTCFGDDDGELTFEIYGGNPLGGSQYTYSVDYLQTMAQATGVVLDDNYFDTDNNSSARTNKYNADNWIGNPIYQGKYYVSVSDQDGCTFTDTVEVGYAHALPVVNITTLASDGTVGLTSMCEGTGNVINLTANVTGGGGTNTFSWSNASTAQTVGVAQTGDYIIEVTDNNTCVGKDTMSIYFQAAPQLVVQGAGTPLYNGTALPSGVGNYNWGNNSQYLGNYDGSAYYIIQNSYQSADGIAIAKALGGKLATPRTKAESDWLADEYSDYGCCNAMIGARYDGTTWVDFDGNELTWSNWWGNSVNGVGNPQHGNPANDNYDMATLNTNKDWYNYQTNDYWWLLLEFPALDAPVTFNQAFCDSIELKANSFVSADGPGFTEIYWTDSQGDTINETEYKTFYADSDVTLNGVFTRSDGQTCDISSATYSFDVFSSPNLVVTNYSGSADLLGGDTIVLVATTDVGTVSWVDSAGTVTNNDTLLVTQPGIYTAKAATANCESFEDLRIDQPLYVAKSGSDATGDGSFTNPYLTIQKGVDQASSGQKIYVLPGTYQETVDIDKSVTIESDYVRLGTANARNTTIIDGNGSPCIEIDNISNDIVVNVNGFRLRDASQTANANQGALSINNSNNTTFTLMNSSITQSANSGDCCGRGGIINAELLRELTLFNVDIFNNGSLTQEARFPINLTNISGGVKIENSTIKSNSFTQWLFRVYNADLEVVNSIIAENSSQWNDRDIFQLEGDGTSIKLNHVTSYGNNQNQLVGLIGINYGSPTIEIYNSIIDADEIINTSEDYTVSNSLLSIGNVFKGSGTNLGTNNVQSTIQLQSGYTLPATSPAIGLADILNGNITNDRNGWSRPLPAGSNPDAGAIEDSLALGEFDFYLSNCGDYISINLLNTDSYSINVTGPANFSSSNLTTIQVGGLGQYLVSVYDSLTSVSITKTINYNNPLNIGFIAVQDACPSNQGYGSITLGNYTGGSRFNYPNDSYWAYTVDIIDSSGNSVANNWHVPDNVGHQNNVSVQSGQYILILTDASGCSIYDTVNVEDLIGSKYYISTTGSDAATGAYSDPLATIQEALNRSCDGDTIILFDGEYFENVELTNTYLPYVTIASEYIEDGLVSHISNTIVNGMDEDPVFDISNHNSTTDTIVFVGFTITNGKSSNWYGGGGISTNYSNIALKHMRVSGNRSGHSGGGIGMDGGYLNLWNTVIENNIASGDGGGIRANYMYRIDGHGSTIIQNNKSNSNGGGISYGHGHWGSTNEDFYIRGFEIVNNSADGTAGGLHVSNWGNNNGTLEIDNIKVVNNRSTSYGAGGASISNNGEDAILSNVIISSNRSNSTGGLELNDVDINIIHTTVYANGVVDGTSANDQIRLQNNSNVLFLNSAVGGQQNVGTSIAHTFYLDDYDTTCDLTISNSIVSGGINSIDNPYSSNIVGTPIGQALYLVNPQQGDYMLSSVSQGLGAGTSSYTGVTMPMIDIEGGLRPNPTGSDPDVGAVESPLDSATFGAAYEIRNNIACDPTYGRLKVIPLNGSGSYKYELDDLTGSATFTDQTNVSSYTYSSLYSGNYLVTITDLSSSDEFTDTVTISGKDSLTLNLVYNDIFCEGEANGAISAIVSGGDGYYDYTWSTISNSNWPKSNKLNNLNPDEYYITVKDGDNCFAEDSVTLSTLHSLPLVAITGNIDKGGTTTQTTNPQVRACAGDIVTLDAGAGYVSYNWTTIDQLNSWSTQTLSASYEEGFYVTVIDSFGCTNTDTAEVFYVQSPAIFASNVNTNIGGTYQQVTSYIEGTNQSTGLNSEPKPYGANERFAKMQFIIPANELIAEGLTDQTAINSLGFEVDIASGSSVQNFKIKVKNTTSNQVGYTFESGLTQVYDFNVLTAGDGWNTHEFDQSFVWDGTKNLLVQVEYSNVAFTNGMDSYLIGHSTSYNSSSVATNSSSSVANQTSANNVWSWRPNMKFGIDKVQATDTLRVCDFTMLNTTDDYDTYSWLVAGSSQGTQLRYSMSSPSEVILKTVDAASSCTMYSDTVQVLLDTTPSVFVTSPVLAGCIGDSVIAAVDTVQSGLTYNWSNGISDTLATFTESGSYYVYAVSPSGCEGVDTVDVSINIPPDVVIELNGRVLTSTDGNLVADNSSCDTTLILPYYSAVDTLSALNNSEWSTYSNNFLEWEYQQGWDSLQDYTGPNYDADSNYFGGFYQFDPASLTDQNKVGYLQLGCINLLGMTNPELSFEYHMVDVYADSSNTSDQMGVLALQLKAAGDADWSTVWQRSGTDSTYDWASKSVALDGYVNQTVQVRWKATAGVGGPRSEIGLDNILVSDSLAVLSNVSGRITAETVCEGDSLYAQAVSNGTTSFGYLWSTGDTTSAISLQTTGWYAVSVMDEENCTVQTDSVFIEVNPAPNNLLVVSDTTQYCAGTFDSLIIAAAAGYDQYEWYFKQASAPSPTPQSCSFDIVLTDSYGDGWNGAIAQLKDTAGTVLQTLGTGFTAGSSYIETVTLTSGETYTIEVSAIGTYVSEIGLEVMKDTVMIGSYQNTSSTGLGTVMSTFTANCSATVTNDAGGYAIIDSINTVTVDSIITGSNSYYVTITDSIGCKATSETVDLIQRDIPSLVMTSAPVLCNNDSTGQAVVQASGSGGFTFDWSNSQDSNVIDNITDGWYSVTVTDSFSCSTIDSVLVVEPSEVSLTAVDFSDVNCFGGNDGFATYTFTGGVGNYQYSWTDSSGVWSSDSLNLTNASAGMYFLNAADSNGCPVLDTVSIGEPPVLALTIDSTSDLTCYQNADGYLSATVTGGFGSYNYYIDGVAAVSLTIDSLDAGSHVVSVVDDNGCSDSASFTLTEPVLLTASTSVVQYLGGIQVSCIGATDGAIDVFVNGGTLPYNYLWADGDTTEDRSNIGAGSYSMTVTDEQGCTVSVNELISEPSALVATSLVDSLDCYGASDGSIAYTLSGATAPYITSWSSNTGSSADSVLATFQVNMNGASINTGGIELITNSGQNYNMNLVPVLEDSIYRVTIAVAVGSTLEYRFFNGSTAETVSSSCGVNVGGTIYRSVTIGSDTTLVAIEFSGCTTTGSAYSGALTGSTRSLTGLSAGSYELIISDVNGCNTILIDSLIEPDSIQISAIVYDASCPQTPDGFIDVTATGGSGSLMYNWSTTDTTEDLTAAYGYYTVTVTDAKGCMDSATYLVDAPFPYNDEELCVVTVDTTGVNLVVWEKTPSQRTADYVILRENAATQYVSVGNNTYLNMSTWADQNSNPSVQPYRYKLVLQDSCGNYSDTSDYHATIHLQASQGVAQNEVNLQWTAYEGKQVQTYYIYRWLSPINRVLVDSVSSNVYTYTDIYPVTTTITALLYEVGAKFVNGGCSPSTGKQSSYANSMSNVLDWGQDGGLPIGTEEWVDVVLGNDLDIYPNPTRGALNLELKGAWEEQEDIQIKITDMTGRILAYRITQGAGTVRFDFEELPAGIYFLNIITGEGRTIVKRFERVN